MESFQRPSAMGCCKLLCSSKRAQSPIQVEGVRYRAGGSIRTMSGTRSREIVPDSRPHTQSPEIDSQPTSLSSLACSY
jgi:hypothetical protein